MENYDYISKYVFYSDEVTAGKVPYWEIEAETLDEAIQEIKQLNKTGRIVKKQYKLMISTPYLVK